jgi:hypothetical protein
MATIDTLLSQRDTKITGESGNKLIAKNRLDSTRFIADNFESFNRIRPHLFHPHQHRTVKYPHKSKKVIDFFLAKDWIKSSGRNAWTLNVDVDLRFFLAGGWLEELVYFAHIEAGVDEIYFGQQVLWDVDGVEGKNEIDVIARRGDVLSFTSCKTISAEKSDKHMGKMRHFITETDYWNIHFANDKGRALLVVTADLIDELHGDINRYPQLFSRATILDVSIAGLEQLRWNELIEAIDNHWS